MKILVVNAIQRETVGDAALLSVLLDQLERGFPGCEIDISSLDDPAEHPSFNHEGATWARCDDGLRPRT